MQRKFNDKAPPKPGPDAINRPFYALGNTYLHELCFTGDASVELIREAVLSLGADTHACNKQNLPPLGLAILQGNLEAIQCLIDLGAELYFPIGQGRFFNATSVAVSSGRPDVLALVLKNGGGLHVNQTGSYPPEREALPCLALAISDCRYTLIEMLAAAGASLDEESGKERLSPLQRAATSPASDAVETLVRLGARIEKPNSVSGLTALHHAVIAGRRGTVDALLRLGADINDKGATPAEETPLHLAVSRGNFDIVAALLAAGANPLLMDGFNRTASRCARSAGHFSIAQKLEEAETWVERAFFEKAYDDLRRRR